MHGLGFIMKEVGGLVPTVGPSDIRSGRADIHPKIPMDIVRKLATVVGMVTGLAILAVVQMGATYARFQGI